jgi:hypothetical protein
MTELSLSLWQTKQQSTKVIQITEHLQVDQRAPEFLVSAMA